MLKSIHALFGNIPYHISNVIWILSFVSSTTYFQIVRGQCCLSVDNNSIWRKRTRKCLSEKKTSKYAQQLHRDRRGNHQVCLLHHSLTDLSAPVVFLKEIVVGLFLKFLISKVILPASPDHPFTQRVFKISQLLKESSVRADRTVLTDQLKSLRWLLS